MSREEWGAQYRKEQEEKAERRKMILLGVAIPLGLVVLIVIGYILKVTLFPVNTAMKSVDVAYKVMDKTLDGDKAIKEYEWFKDQEAYIRTCLKNEEIAKQEWEDFKSELDPKRDNWAREDKDEENSLRNSYTALQKLTNRAIEDYNAKSSMVTRNIWKDNLPSNITRAFYAGIKLTE